ncbi:beclin 1-associated autophagy-related key regulator [Macrosteles quadrilineatus]|uniref:beclin 1-associated autophagy-related key regulator n=1 Tax=Macrosteles quadrilineatus TaxID=74068 RepID=UPI0023E0CF95|nr:beclin 1-associated autophagy-related key regulator [Macrosteles quadrilineatus]
MASIGTPIRGNVQVDFNLYSSSIDGNITSSSSLQECPLCCKSRKVFYCKTCINNGDYFRSTAPCAERYAEKRLRLMRLKKEKRDIELECEKLLEWRLLKIKLISEIDDHKERIKLLRCLIKKSQEEIAHKKTVIAQLKCDNEKSVSQTLPLYREKVQRLQGFVVHHNNDVASRRQRLADVQQELKKVIRIRIHELVKYIFPISAVQPSRSQDSSGTQSALNEAATTTYMCGRWVTTDVSGQLHHSIVAPTLPASGDYSSYNDWVSASKDGVPMTNIESIEQNQAYNISAALTYTTQLVNVIAFYLGIKLPNKLCYSELCSTALSENKFARRVARLNLNVLHLCLSQNVPAESIHPSQTLQNILYLLESEDLGRIGPVQVEPLVSRALEDQLRVNLDTSSDDSGSEEDSDHLPLEWEAVPHVSSVDMSHTPVHTHSTNVAGGLMASATASLASILRGWTTNR